jgi:enamine deaminase RidA (YjgF/YER057c/UK114 family)
MIFYFKMIYSKYLHIKGVIMITRKIIGARMSKIVEHNGVIYFSGIVPNDKTLDIKGQTLDVLNIAKELFLQANTDNENILRAEIYLKNIDRDFVDFNGIWDEWVSKENPPARACVEASMSTPETLVEIIFTSVKK